MLTNIRLFEDDLPAVNAVVPPPLPDDFELREIQKIAYDNLIKAYVEGYRKPVLMAATGSGKTKLAGYLIHQALTKNPDQRIAFIVPRETLLEQAYKEFTDFFGFETSVIMSDDERIDLRKQVQVCTIQTLGRRIEKNPVFAKLVFGMAFIDEAHIEFKSREVLNALFVVGLSASPYGRSMGLYYDTLVKTIPATELCKSGVITPLVVMSAQAVTQIDRSELGITSTGEYAEADEEKAVETIIANVVEKYQESEDMKGRKFIGFARTIATCASLCDEFIAKGYRVGYVHSKMSKEDCQAQLDLFKAGLLDGIWSVVKLIEGFDFPAVDALIVATVFAPSKKDPQTPNALTRYVQLAGRGRRGNVPGKEYCLVHDHGGNYFNQFHDPDLYEIGFDKLLKGKKKDPNEDKPAEMKVKTVECPVCEAIIRGKRCQRCMHELKTYSKVVDGAIIEYVDGEMVKMNTSHDQSFNKEIVGKKLTKEEKQELFTGLKWHYQDKRMEWGGRPLADGFIARQYREITGVWPRGIDKAISNKTDLGDSAGSYLDMMYKQKQGVTGNND